MQARIAVLASLILFFLIPLNPFLIKCADPLTYYGQSPGRMYWATDRGQGLQLETWTIANYSLLAIVAYQDATEVKVYELPNKQIAETKLDRMDKFFYKISNGTYFKVVADKMVSVFLEGGNVGNLSIDPSLPRVDYPHTPAGFHTSVEGGYVGNEFILIAFQGSDYAGIPYRVVALEDCEVNVKGEDGSILQTFKLKANEFKELSFESFKAYEITSTGNIMVHSYNIGSFPSVDGGFVGTRFFSACSSSMVSWSPSRDRALNSIQITAVKDAKVTIYDTEYKKKVEELTVPGGTIATVRPQAKEIFIEADNPIMVSYVNYNVDGAGVYFESLAAGEKAIVNVPTSLSKQESCIFTREETTLQIDGATIKLNADSYFLLPDGAHEISTDKNIVIQIIFSNANPIQGIRMFGDVLPAIEKVDVKNNIILKPILGEESNMMLYVGIGIAVVAVVASAVYALRVRRRTHS